MFSVRRRSAVINSRFCLKRPDSLPRVCRRKIAREFNFGETTFVLPKNDPANTCRVRIFTPREELDFAGHPTVGTACALVMKQHVRPSDPIRLILEENVGPVTVDVAERNGGFHGTLTLSGKIDAPTGAPSPTDLAAIYLAGGSSQIPLISEVIAERLGVGPQHLNDSKAVICLGAALWKLQTTRIAEGGPDAANGNGHTTARGVTVAEGASAALAAAAAGAHAVLMKPLGTAELAQCLAQVLARARTGAQPGFAA